MKKILLFVIAASICVALNAQEHLKFKNVPIDGPMKEFLQKIQQKDLKLTEEKDAGATLVGRLAGKQVEVFVLATEEGIPYRVCAFFETPGDWDAMKMDYFNIQRSLSFKYGKPTTVNQRFQFPDSEGDGKEMEALGHNRGNWFTTYIQPEGAIILTITTNPFSNTPAVAIIYEDQANSKRQDEIISQDL